MIKSNTMQAVFWMFGALLSLLAVSVLGKALAADYNTFEIMFYRSWFAAVLLVIFFSAARKWGEIRPRNYQLHFARNVVHFSAQNLWFYALAYLPLGVVITFEFTTPAWVIVIAALFLGEGFGVRRLIVIVLSLVGVLVSTLPQLTSAGQITMGAPLYSAILAAVGFALTTIFTKRLTRVQSVFEILLVMTLMQGVFATVLVFIQGDLEMLHLHNVHLLVLIGVFGTTSHYSLTRALSLADASVVAPIDLLRLPLSIFVGVILFQDPFSYWVVVGGIILIISNYFNIQRQAR